MDAVRFIKERNRMCKMYYEAGDDVCSDCPAKYEKCTMLEPMEIITEDEIAKIVKIVEEWSAAYPRKTRQDVFLEQWPEAKVESDGISSICPAVLSKAYRMYSGEKCPTTITTKICNNCRREFWGEVVE